MKQLTLRGLGPELEAHLMRISEEENLSLNQAAVRLMRKGAGLSERRLRANRIGTRLDAFFGTMSAKEAKQITDAVKDFERVDPEFWK
jgi:hypothetical protein